MAGFARDLTAAISAAIETATSRPFKLRTAQRINGSSAHRTLAFSDGERRYFVKINAATFADHFKAEVEGLHALRKAGARVPVPITTGRGAEHAFIVLEYLELARGLDARDEWAVALAHMLADLHEVSGAHYGWPYSNFIGMSVQLNTPSDSWVDFWRDYRLIPQLRLAERIGHDGELITLGERVADALPALFDGHAPAPSLLHGDLWNGNAAFTAGGEPVIYDPAVYYGDREADIAMTELFGGFPREFHDTYFDLAPVNEGYALRRDVYNLYHVLNHLNLFGGVYREKAQALMQRALAEIS